MQKSQRMRIALDMTMTLLSITLMGGTVLFPDERVHQVLGMALLAMWAACADDFLAVRGVPKTRFGALVDFPARKVSEADFVPTCP